MTFFYIPHVVDSAISGWGSPRWTSTLRRGWKPPIWSSRKKTSRFSRPRTQTCDCPSSSTCWRKTGWSPQKTLWINELQHLAKRDSYDWTGGFVCLFRDSAGSDRMTCYLATMGDFLSLPIFFCGWSKGIWSLLSKRLHQQADLPDIVDDFINVPFPPW